MRTSGCKQFGNIFPINQLHCGKKLWQDAMRGHFAWLLQSQCCHMAPGDIICHHIVDAAMRCICNKTSDGVSTLRAYCNGNVETKLWTHLISCSRCWSACGRGSDGTPYVIGLRSLDSAIKRSATISHKSLCSFLVPNSVGCFMASSRGAYGVRKFFSIYKIMLQNDSSAWRRSLIEFSSSSFLYNIYA